MYFLVKDDLVENYNEIWEKVSITRKKNSKPVHNKKYLKAEKNQHKRRLSM